MKNNPFNLAAHRPLPASEARPIRFDITVEKLGPSYQQLILELADHGALNMVTYGENIFISSDELIEHIPGGTCLWDEYSAAYIPPDAWVDDAGLDDFACDPTL